MSRLLLVRIPAGADLVGHVEALAVEHGLRCALVRGGPGSLMRATLQSGGPPVEVPGPAAEILAMVGEVAMVEGRAAASLHGVVGDPEGRVYAGRFVRGGCPVCITVELALEERDPATPPP